MTTVTVSDIPLESGSPAQRLRRVAAAVRVSLHWWGTHKTLTTQQKEEVGVAYDADSRFLTAGKKLVDTRHEAFRRLTSVRTRLGNDWRGLTLPYTEPGVRLIRQADIEAFVHTMEGFRDELTQGEADLNAVYDEIKADARRRLGRLYNPADYPPEVQGLFGVEWDFPSVEPPNYLMRINPEIYRQEQERVVRRFEEAVQLAEQAFITEFSRLVSHLAERLGNGEGGERRVFRDSVVTNLTDFFDRFKNLSVRSNEELDRLVEQAQQLVQGISPQDLRDDNQLRGQIAAEMNHVQTTLEGMMVERPRRQIIRANAPRNGVSHAAGH
jgi:hypothetical protein